MKGFSLIELMVIMAVVGIVGAIVLGFMPMCSSSNDATEALTSAGYSDIEITGYKFFGCDEKDTFHTGFCAKNPKGNRVCGVVCSGWLKGGTIRF